MSTLLPPQIPAPPDCIETDTDYVAAADLLLATIELADRIRETFDPIVKAAHTAHRTATVTRTEHLEQLDAAVTSLKAAMLDYHTEAEEEARETPLDPLDPHFLPLPPPPPEVERIQYRQSHTAEITDRRALITHCLQHWDTLGHLITVDRALANHLARQSAGGIDIPGVKMGTRKTIAIRTKK